MPRSHPQRFHHCPAWLHWLIWNHHGQDRKARHQPSVYIRLGRFVWHLILSVQIPALLTCSIILALGCQSAGQVIGMLSINFLSDAFGRKKAIYTL